VRRRATPTAAGAESLQSPRNSGKMPKHFTYTIRVEHTHARARAQSHTLTRADSDADAGIATAEAEILAPRDTHAHAHAHAHAHVHAHTPTRTPEFAFLTAPLAVRLAASAEGPLPTARRPAPDAATSAGPPDPPIDSRTRMSAPSVDTPSRGGSTYRYSANSGGSGNGNGASTARSYVEH
jgi:hypothetical protein